MNREERRRINGPAGDLPNTKNDFDAFEEDEYRKSRFDDVISDNSRVQDAYEVIKDSLGEEVADAILDYDVEGYGNGERLIDAITVLFSDHDTRRRRLNREATIRNYKDEIDSMKRTPKPMIPESKDSPFNGMSVSQMRFLNESMMDDSRYSVSFRGGALDPHPISIEVEADCEQTALEMAVAKLERDYEGRCLIDPQEVENGGDDYNEDNALYVDATAEGASQPWYVDPQMVHIEELPPRGYDGDGYDSMDDNALPEDF